MKGYNISSGGEVLNYDWIGEEKMTPRVMALLAVAGLRESSENMLAVELANKMEKRWESPSPDSHELIRAHIASCLGCLRAFHGTIHNRTDYLLSVLAGSPQTRYFDKYLYQATKRLNLVVNGEQLRLVA